MQDYGQLQEFSQCGTEICKRHLLHPHNIAKYLTPPRCTDTVHRTNPRIVDWLSLLHCAPSKCTDAVHMTTRGL